MLRAFLKWAGVMVALAATTGTPAAARDPNVVRPTTIDNVGIGRQLQVLVDPSGHLTLDDVRARQDDFTPVETDWPTYGIGRGAAWTRITFDLSDDPLRDVRRIQFGDIHPDVAEFFAVDDSGTVLRRFTGGLDHPESTTYRKYSMSLAGLPARFTLFTRLTTHHISTLTLTLTSAEQETADELLMERALGPVFGAMALAVAYCLLLWAYLRESTYGYGFAFVLSLLVASHPYVNADRLYWPDALLQPDVSRAIYFLSVGLLPAFGLLFSTHFLQAPRYRPLQHRIALATAGAIAAGHTFVVAVQPYWFLPMNTLGLVAGLAAIGWLLVTALVNRVDTARIHVLITVPVLASLSVTNFASYGVLQRHPVLTSVTVFGLAMLAGGVTFMLADGFRRRLESKVRERTLALSTANAALKDANAAKNRMLGVVAHDLRNPLSAIKSAAQLLLEFPLPQNNRDTIAQTIRDGAQMSLAMTEDLLDVAAIEQGTIALESAPCDLAALVGERLDLFRLTAQPKDIIIDVRGAALPLVWADKKRVGQVLDNLVSNAVKFSPPRGTVTIALQADAGRAKVSVVDNGAGIPPDEIDQIFVPFKRASTRPTGGEPSTGLGLAIVKRLAEAQGGAIAVHSTPGAGSRFDLFLPFSTDQRNGVHGVPDAAPQLQKTA